MNAKDVMTTNVVSVNEDTPVNQIATLLVDRHISGAPVVDAGGRVVGVVTEGDLIVRAETPRRRSWWLSLFADSDAMAREFVKSHAKRARDVMTQAVITVTESTPVGDVARLLEEKRIKRVPVVQGSRLVGIVSRADILRALAARGMGPGGPAAQGDETIRAQVISAIQREPWAEGHLLNVVVDHGVVHLWGLAESKDAARALRVAAENVAGVKEVVNHVALRQALPPGV